MKKENHDIIQNVKLKQFNKFIKKISVKIHENQDQDQLRTF